MATQATVDQKSLINQKIISIVSSAWNERNKATLVAQIGTILSIEFDLRKDLEGVKLADFIKANLSDKLRFVNSPKDSRITAVVPIDAKLESDIKSYFDYDKKIENTNSDFTRININRSVWKAFSQDISPDLNRHIRLEPKVHFIDNTSANHDGYFLIDKKYINPTEQNKYQRNISIQRNIFEWARENGIEEDKYILKASSSVPSGEVLSIFAKLVETLDKDDFARITIPLDVVIKLQNTPCN